MAPTADCPSSLRRDSGKAAPSGSALAHTETATHRPIALLAGGLTIPLISAPHGHVGTPWSPRTTKSTTAQQSGVEHHGERPGWPSSLVAGAPTIRPAAEFPRRGTVDPSRRFGVSRLPTGASAVERTPLHQGYRQTTPKRARRRGFRTWRRSTGRRRGSETPRSHPTTSGKAQFTADIAIARHRFRLVEPFAIMISIKARCECSLPLFGQSRVRQ